MQTSADRERGYTLPELLMVVSIGVTLMALSVGGIMSLVKTSRADGGLTEAMMALEWARETSVSQRRNMQLVFNAPNQISIIRADLPSGTTTLRTIELEGRVQFLTFATVPDTPAAFGKTSATAFGSSTPVMYTTDGSLISANGDVVNGTLFLGVTNEPLSARALTVFGATGAVTPWVWDGRQWNER
jgi:prepilin-type N-terminal cleavage/methylation domain-containing protein